MLFVEDRVRKWVVDLGGEAMSPIYVGELTSEQIAELDRLYHSAKSMRVRTRAQMILLSAELQLVPHQIASIVRRDEQTVRRWIKRYQAEGAAGLEDAPQPGREPKFTPEYRSRLLEIVRRRPRSLDLPFSLWTLQRLADFMAEETGLRLSYETVRRILKRGGIVLSRLQHKITSPDPEYQLKKRRLKANATTSNRGRFSTTLTSST
jgi:transposase